MKQEEISLSEKQIFEVTREDHLSLRGVDIVDICEKYGTPLFVFDELSIRENYQRFSKAFENYPKTNICYSVKTNNNLAICKIMKEEGAYAEVGSGLDLYIAKEAGFPPDRIIFDGLYKPEQVLREALEYGVSLINVESFSELELLNKIAGEMGKKQNIGIRISTFAKKRLNPEDLYCNPLSRFGFLPEDVDNAFSQALKMGNLEVKGIMIHPYWGIYWFLPLVKRIQEKFHLKIEYINFGGGFLKPGTRKVGISDLLKDYLRQKFKLKSKLDMLSPKKIREIEEAGKLTIAEVDKVLGNRDATLVFEPGRYLIHDTGFLLLRAGTIKEAGGYKWVVVDGGVNLNSDYLERRKIRLVNRMSAPPSELTNVVGPLLFARDFVTIKQKLPEIRIGDILAVSNSGAYTLSNSTQFLNPRPSAVLISPDGKVNEIREKEAYKDVTRMDIT
jgi:diaminopimelate decarboxylase